MKSEKIIVKVSRTTICSTYFFINGRLVLKTESNCFFGIDKSNINPVLNSVYKACKNVFYHVGFNKKAVSVIVEKEWIKIIDKYVLEEEKWRKEFDEKTGDNGYSAVKDWKKKEYEYRERKAQYSDRK